MNQPPGNAWSPDPELLAAYFDGELEARDDGADLRARIEAWMEANPDAKQLWAEHQELKKLWVDTAPAEPSATAWKQTLERIDAARKETAPKPVRRRSWVVTAVIAASILLFIALVLGGLQAILNKQGTGPDKSGFVEADDEIMQVATASEITILRIESEDADGVVVGTFPVSAPLELAASGEVSISCKCPRVCVRQEWPHRPMVYARANTD